MFSAAQADEAVLQATGEVGASVQTRAHLLLITTDFSDQTNKLSKMLSIFNT